MVDHQVVRTRALAAGGLLLLSHLVASGLLAWATAGLYGAIRAPGPAPVDALLALSAAVGAWVALTWLTALTALTVLTAAVAGLGSRAHRRAAAITPRLCRRLAGALLGLTVAGAPLSAAAPPVAAAVSSVATAPTDGAPSSDRLPLPGSDALDRPATGVPPGWTPDRPAAPPRLDPRSGSLVRLVASRPRVGRDVVDEVVVRRGDTLWDITARHLGPHTSAAEVAAEWPRWHAANATVIGPDPDLLLPGQRLLPPRP